MNPRVTTALVVVAAALGAYVWFVELPREEADESEKRILSLDAGAVTALEVPLDGGKTARLVRAGGGPTEWALEAPLAFPADDAAVDRLVESLARLDWAAALESVPEELAPFGLGARDRVLRVWTGEGDPTELVLGGSAPIGFTRYLLLDGEVPALFTIEQGGYDQLQPALNSLRDKRIARLAPGEVDALHVAVEGGTLVAAARQADDPDDPDWHLVEPSEERADGARILRLIQDLAFARAVEFIDDEVDEKTGLGAPEVEVTLSAAERVERVALGRADDRAYARVEGRDVVYEVPTRVLDSVPRTLFEYRFKKVLEIGDETAARIDLYFPRESVAYAFARLEDGWATDAEDVEVDTYKVEDILYAVRDLDASGAEEADVDLAAVGLDPPRVRVTLRNADDEELGFVDFGEPDLELGLAARSSQSDRVWRVRNDLGRDVPLGLEAFDNQWNTWSPEPAGDAPDAAAPDPDDAAPDGDVR